MWFFMGSQQEYHLCWRGGHIGLRMEGLRTSKLTFFICKKRWDKAQVLNFDWKSSGIPFPQTLRSTPGESFPKPGHILGKQKAFSWGETCSSPRRKRNTKKHIFPVVKSISFKANREKHIAFPSANGCEHCAPQPAARATPSARPKARLAGASKAQGARPRARSLRSGAPLSEGA